MIRVSYDQAVSVMQKGLMRYMDAPTAKHFAKIFAGNSADGVHSHGINRYLRYLSDMEKGLCDATVTQAERVSGLGGLEIWDAHFGIGPLIAEQVTERAVELAKTHGIACVALRNNSHWLRAGRYALMMADAGMVGLCMTNTTMNLVAYGAKEPSTGNNPLAMGIPREAGSLVMDMAVSQYAFGKLEIMAQEGKMLDTACGYDTQGKLTNDPVEINKSKLMMPMALWKGSALSIMIDLLVSMMSMGRTSLQIGRPNEGEKGMSQLFICMNPRAVVDQASVEQQMEETIAFLNGLEDQDGKHRVHAPGQNMAKTREEAMQNGIPVTEETWQKILDVVQ